MSKLFKVVAVGFASMALAFGATACGDTKTTTDTVTKTDPAVTTTEPASTTTPATTTTPPDPNGVQPITPGKGSTPGTCPAADPVYDAATGLCYPKGAKIPE
jgi:hypothetical protein